jgi:hypothetical protein
MSYKNTPPILKNNAYFVSVPFELKKVKYALNNFSTECSKSKNEAPSSRTYNWDNIQL